MWSMYLRHKCSPRPQTSFTISLWYRTQVLKLFKRDGEQEPRIFLCKLLKKLADWSEQQEMEGKKKQVLTQGDAIFAQCA